jgi:hypothetical protein
MKDAIIRDRLAIKTYVPEDSKYIGQQCVAYLPGPENTVMIDFQKSYDALLNFLTKEQMEWQKQNTVLRGKISELEKKVNRLSSIIIKGVELVQSGSSTEKSELDSKTTISKKRRRITSEDLESDSSSEPCRKYKRRVHHPIPEDKKRETAVRNPEVISPSNFLVGLTWIMTDCIKDYYFVIIFLYYVVVRIGRRPSA